MEAIEVRNGELHYTSAAPSPAPLDGEALVAVTLAGICSTDLEIVRGYAGFSGILGHEFVGRVVDVARAADGAWVGRRVVGTINVSPTCDGACGRRCPEHCPDRTVLGIIDRPGVFATHTALPIANLLAVPDTVSDEQAVFVEPLAAAVRVTEQLTVRAAQRVAVIGPGRLGLLVARVLQHAGGAVTVLGRSPASLQLPAAWGLAAGLVDDAPTAGFDVVVEATGNSAGLAHALRLLVPQGTLVLKSTYADSPAVDLTPIVVNELTVIGSRCGPFAPALDLLAAGVVDTAALVDGRYPLAEAAAAIRHAAAPGVRKILLQIS